MTSAEYQNGSTESEITAQQKVGDAYLGTAAKAEEFRGIEVAATPYSLAAQSYAEALRLRDDPITHVKEALCLEALAEAEAEADPANSQILRESARADIHKAWEIAGGSDAAVETVAPILLVEAEILAAEGDTEGAQKVLGTLNGNTPPAVAKLAKELAEHGTLSVNHVAEALLEIKKAA